MYCPLDGCHCYQWPLYHGPNDNCNDSCCYWLVVVVVEDDVVVVVCCCQHRIYIDMWHKISLFIVRSRWPSNPRCVVDWLFSGLWSQCKKDNGNGVSAGAGVGVSA